jgi:hypothetical protein
MQPSLLRAVRERRPHARTQWETLLRTEPVTSPLGHPDALVHLIDWTLDEILVELVNPSDFESDPATGRDLHSLLPCPCGRNPLLHFFAAGRQALREALILAQAASVPLDPRERDSSFTELDAAFRRVSHREIEAFCSLCQLRGPEFSSALAEQGASLTA